MTPAAALASLRVGARVRADAAHPAGIVRMLNPHSRLAVLVAWAHGSLEWRSAGDLTLLSAERCLDAVTLEHGRDVVGATLDDALVEGGAEIFEDTTGATP